MVEAGSMRQVLGIRPLTAQAYVLRIDCADMCFRPGQHVTLGMHGDPEMREYSIYSAPGAPYLEVLITETDPGLVSRRLRQCRPGDRVLVNGPYGFFTLPEERCDRILAVATGTGIAPFHSMCCADPGRDIMVLHGIRSAADAYDRQDYRQYVACTSRTSDGDFHGRVTAYLQTHDVGAQTQVYLCGNCEMIYTVYDILQAKGVAPERIRTEVYF